MNEIEKEYYEKNRGIKTMKMAKIISELLEENEMLLRELKSILQWMDNELDWKYVPQIENVREDIQQAIEKAEGKA